MSTGLCVVRCHPASVADAFVRFLPGIRRCLQSAFQRLDPEAREDALQEAIASCFSAFTRLWERGRQHLASPSTLARFAVARWFDGRRVGSRLNRRDVLAPHVQRRRGIRLWSLENHESLIQPAALEDRRAPIPDQAAFRVDFPEWLGQLTPRKRRIAVTLAHGESTSGVSARFGLSPARVSQLRRELHGSWRAFHGELDVCETPVP